MFKFFLPSPKWREPSALVKKVVAYKSKGTVLDLGAGYGRNSAFLAQQGFSVTAVELEEEQAESLRKKSTAAGLPITVVQTDMTQFISSSHFDVILCNNSLHFCTPETIEEIFKNMRAMTASQGVHVISAYTDQNPKGLRPYLFKNRELEERYRDWKILLYTQDADGHPSVTPKEPKDNGPVKRYTTQIIAQKV